MKKTVLKINNLNMENDRLGKLKHVSFYILEGEVTAFLGLNYSGKELVISALKGEQDINWVKEQFYVDGHHIRKVGEIKKAVYYMQISGAIIENWMVSEYIGHGKAKAFLNKKNVDVMVREAEKIFGEIGFPIDGRKKMNQLTELEYRVVELARAKIKGSRILIIEDECEGLNRTTIVQYATLLKNMIRNHMAVIFMCHSDQAMQILADQSIIFRRGRVVKKWRLDTTRDIGDVNDYLLGTAMTDKKQRLDSYTRKIHMGDDIVFGIRDVIIQKEKENYDFKKGEITTFIIQNNKERVHFFDIISGRKISPDVGYRIDNQEKNMTRFSDFISSGIVSYLRQGDEYEIFNKMSVGDNLIIPSIKKVTSLNYLVEGKQMAHVLNDEMEGDALSKEEVVKKLKPNERINIALNRWFIFNPKVIILYEPFTSCDTYGVSLITSYIKKFSNRGTTVIVIKSNSEYMDDISDRMFIFD